MNMSDAERQLAVSVISDCLRQSGGDSGKMMLDAYYLGSVPAEGEMTP